MKIYVWNSSRESIVDIGDAIALEENIIRLKSVVSGAVTTYRNTLGHLKTYNVGSGPASEIEVEI